VITKERDDRNDGDDAAPDEPNEAPSSNETLVGGAKVVSLQSPCPGAQARTSMKTAKQVGIARIAAAAATFASLVALSHGSRSGAEQCERRASDDGPHGATRPASKSSRRRRAFSFCSASFERIVFRGEPRGALPCFWGLGPSASRGRCAQHALRSATDPRRRGHGTRSDRRRTARSRATR